ncbi:Pvc16 family protein [Kitasatospora sp. NPDC058115]|uniref:Pvc16 family protein n=1 Tax=Kitasatospora sp. NPDC058115 TaxID=3346347 RepID=UPI0036DF1786
MSNHLAIATVSEALRLLLTRALSPDIPFAVEVGTRKPPTEPPADPTVTVFLYQVTPNASLRNLDAPTRAADGTLLTRPAAALDLHYLISCYGEESQLVGQRLLGCVVRALTEQPVLPRQLIEEAAARPYLAGSDLAAAPQRVRLTPTPMDVDELSKLWTTLFQTPYALSVVYQATAVLVEGRADPVAGRPVLRRTVRAVPSRAPVVERVRSRPAGSRGAPEEGPVTKDRELVLDGSGLRADLVVARLGEWRVPVGPDGVRDDRLVVAVPEDLPPGVHQVQVLHGLALDGRPATDHLAMESNAQSFARQPRILAPIGITDRRVGPNGVSARLSVRLDLPLRDDQRVLLLLDESRPPAGRPGASHQFRAPAPSRPRPDPYEVRVPVVGVRPTAYLARVQVDGVPSALTVAADGSFSGPLVDLTH